MDQSERAGLDARVQEHLHQADVGAAAEHALRGYGPEVLGFLVATARDETVAADAFAIFCEDVWKGLPGFRFTSSLRTWLYAVARHAMHRVLRDPRRKREMGLDQASAVQKLEHELRTSTLPYLKTAVKDRFHKLRESLEPDEQALLTLRLDRQLEWDEVATVMLDDGEGTDAAAVKKKAAALRKRFERVKEKLKELAKKEGLVGA